MFARPSSRALSFSIYSARCASAASSAVKCRHPFPPTQSFGRDKRSFTTQGSIWQHADIQSTSQSIATLSAKQKTFSSHASTNSWRSLATDDWREKKTGKKEHNILTSSNHAVIKRQKSTQGGSNYGLYPTGIGDLGRRLSRFSGGKLGESPFTSVNLRTTNLGTLGLLQRRGYQRADENLDIESRRSIYRGTGKIEKSIGTVKFALAGTVVIICLKFACFLATSSSSMLAEAVHSLVDLGNQTLLLIGLRTSSFVPDTKHQYGYGKSVYFWSLVSALGTFWVGAGFVFAVSGSALTDGGLQLESVNWMIWAVLAMNFLVDAVVFKKSYEQICETKPKNMSFFRYLQRVRDPTTLAILYEDGAACLGVMVAVAGVGLSQMTNNPIYDTLGGFGVGLLLAGVGLELARVNHRFLIGQSIDKEVEQHIVQMLMERPAIEHIHSVQSQWIGPHNFSFKAEVDFDGTYLAAELMHLYEKEFAKAEPSELKVLLAWYAEDVVRATEREVKSAETQIRLAYPEAAFIELEPDSTTAALYAIESNKTAVLVRKEKAAIASLLSEMERVSYTLKAKGIVTGDPNPTADQIYPPVRDSHSKTPKGEI